MTIGCYFCETPMKMTKTTHLHNIRQEKANSQKCGQNGEEKKLFRRKKKVFLENYYLEKVSDFKPIITQWHTPFCQYSQSLINSSTLTCVSCSMTNSQTIYQILPVAQTHRYTSRLRWGPMKILLTEVLTKPLHTEQINQPTPKEVKQKFHFWKEQQETHLTAPLINLLW